MNSTYNHCYSPTASLENFRNQLVGVEHFDDASHTINLISDVKIGLETYAAYVFENDLEPQILMDLLETIQNQLLRITDKIEQSSFSLTDSDQITEQLSGCHKVLRALLLNHTARKGIIESTKELYQESKATQEIKWKVKKYESLIIALSKVLQNMSGKSAQTLAEVLKLPRDYQQMVDENNAKRYTLENLSVVRRIYSNYFMQCLRNLTQMHPSDHDLLEICYYLYCNISLEKENQNVLNLFDQWGENCTKELHLKSQFTHSVVVAFDLLVQRVNHVPQTAKAPLLSIYANSMRGVFNRDFDPAVQGNPIHCLYAIQMEGKEVRSLGFGSPTREELTFYNSAELTPEFFGFLSACKNKEKRHLYFMNQDITSNGYIAGEKQRCDLVMCLQNDEAYKGSFFAVALSKDSAFYYQKGKEYDCSKDFLDDLIAQFDLPDSGSLITQEIRQMSYLNLRVISDAIHRHLFQWKAQLNKAERLIFIEAFYDQITKWLIFKMGVDTFNISCKDAIDRGAASNAQLYSHLAIVNEMFTEEHQRRTQVLMIVRALLVRKRGPKHGRVVRFLETLDFYLNHQNELKRLHEALFGKTQFMPGGF